MNSTLIAMMAALMMTVGAGFVYFILRDNERPVPRGGVQWAAVSLSVLLVLFSGFLLALTLLPPPPPEYAGPDPLPEEMNRPAPDFTFKTVADNEEFSLEDYAGRVVLLNIWATWCGPCLVELPELNRLQEAYRDQGLVVLTLSDEPRGELLAFEATMPLQTLSAYITETEDMPEPFRRTVTSQVRPSTYVIDREGVLRVFFTGRGEFDFFEQVLEPYLGTPLAAR